MPVPGLLSDLLRLFLQLAPAAAVLSIVLAGLALRSDGGSIAIGGNFAKWMMWAIVFITLGPLLSWFSSFGIGGTLPTGAIGTSWLSSFQTDVSTFVTNFIVGRLITTLAAYSVLRAILQTAEGGNPLPSILSAMFLLGTQATYALMQGYNSGTQFATADVLDRTWNYLAGTIMPIAAGLAVIGAVFNVATRRPAARLVAVALALLCVTGIWKLVLAMEA
jgi:hypothetical protein